MNATDLLANFNKQNTSGSFSNPNQNEICFNDYRSSMQSTFPVEIETNLFSKNNLLNFEKKLKANNQTAPLATSQLNFILALRNYYVQECLSTNDITGKICFSTLLSFCIDKENSSMPKMATQLGISLSTLYSYLYGKRFPTVKQKTFIEQLDNYFNLAAGCFTQTLGHILNGNIQNQDKNSKTGNKGLINKDAQDTSELLAYSDFPSTLRKEIDYIIKFHTSSHFETDFPNQKRKKTAIWKNNTTDGKIYQAKSFAERFFGYQHFILSTPLQDLSFSQMLPPKTIDNYITYRNIQIGFLSFGIEEDLKTLRVITDENFGVITQNKNTFRGKLLKQSSWEHICQESFTHTVKLLETEDFKNTDDSNKALSFIFTSKTPLMELEALLKSIEKDASVPRMDTDERMRNFIIILIVFGFNYNASVIAQMQIGVHIKKISKNWIIVLPDGNTATLPIRISDHIEHYINKTRNSLHGASESDLLFLSSKRSGANRTIGMTPRNITRVFEATTKLYSPSKHQFSIASVERLMRFLLLKDKKLSHITAPPNYRLEILKAAGMN